MGTIVRRSDAGVVQHICELNWQILSKDRLADVAWAYYYFSIQFRENLKVARAVNPDDASLLELESEECDTANLSPWPGVALPGERMNHDEFMRRTLALAPLPPERGPVLSANGRAYLDAVRECDPEARALSIVSYEGGGLERVFRAILTAPDWSSPLLAAFRHFLAMHLKLDDHHGALVHHLQAGEAAVPFWQLFEELLLNCVPELAVRDAPAKDDHIGLASFAAEILDIPLPSVALAARN